MERKDCLTSVETASEQQIESTGWFLVKIINFTQKYLFHCSRNMLQLPLQLLNSVKIKIIH